MWLFLLAGLGGAEVEAREAVIRSELLVLSESHPGGALMSLGTTASGRDIPGVVLASTTTSRAERAVLVVGDALGEGERGARLAVELAHTWIQAPVEGIDLYVVPRLDPDGDPFADVQVGVNFPVGWRPSTDLAGAGAFPLQRPEAQALAEFLRGHPELVGVWSPGEVGDPGGSLFAFAAECFGLVATSGDPNAGGDERAATFLHWLSQLPSLRLTHAGSRDLGGGLWELDLELVNVGRLPCWLSDSAAGSRRPVDLSLKGAEILGAAAARADETLKPVALGRDAEVVGLEPLDGGEWRALRLVVRRDEAESSALEFEVRATRVGADRLTVELLPALDEPEVLEVSEVPEIHGAPDPNGTPETSGAPERPVRTEESSP